MSRGDGADIRVREEVKEGNRGFNIRHREREGGGGRKEDSEERVYSCNIQDFYSFPPLGNLYGGQSALFYPYIRLFVWSFVVA